MRITADRDRVVDQCHHPGAGIQHFRLPLGAFFVFCDHYHPHRNRPLSRLSAQRLDWMIDLIMIILDAPERESFRERMNTGLLIEHGVLVRIVQSPKTDKFGSQSGLSFKTACRNDDGLTFPTNDSSVDKYVANRILSHRDADCGTERIKQISTFVANSDGVRLVKRITRILIP